MTENSHDLTPMDETKEKRIIAAIKDGVAFGAIAKTHRVSPNRVAEIAKKHDLKSVFDKTGKVGRERDKGRKR